MRWPWQQRFADEFAAIGEFISDRRIRISMHPDQYVIPSSPDAGVRERSAAELRYHAEVLDLLGCGQDAKCQIHLGGAYGDRNTAIDRFVETYAELDDAVRSRLVIENDDRIFSVADCLRVSERTGIPVLVDSFHHAILGGGESVGDCLARTQGTWRRADGVPMVDYASQATGKRPGAHAATIDPADFERFLAASSPFDIDVMLEIKDKEASALVATEYAASDPRFVG
jgi:UV DNA damage endonuclease